MSTSQGHSPSPSLSDIAADLLQSVDPLRFAASLGFPNLDEWQKELLLSNDKRVLLLAARQVGKSAICAIIALHEALNRPGSLILIVSPSLRQSGELFKRILGFYQDLGRPIPPASESALSLKLANKSRIVSLPSKESTVRGFPAVSLLLFDESALTDDDLYRAMRPMLAVSNGRIIAIGTPHGKRGWFWKEWTEGEEWKRYKINAEQCPRISKEFLRAERRALGDHWYAQEYENKFTESESALLRSDVIKRAIREDVTELDLDLGLPSDGDYKSKRPPHTYLDEQLTLDLGPGPGFPEGGDE